MTAGLYDAADDERRCLHQGISDLIFASMPAAVAFNAPAPTAPISSIEP